jgi:hypothetical protein
MINIYSPNLGSRIKYVIEFIFRDLLELNYTLTDKVEGLNGIIINYSKEKIEQENYHIYPSDFLINGKRDFLKYIVDKHFFPSKEGHHSFDIFSAVFFLISRMEEYDSSNLDQHQRFISKNSFLVKFKFEEKPLIDIWCMDLLKKINKLFKSNLISSKKFFQYCTFDIDNAYAFKNKGGLRYIGGFLKDLYYLRTFKISQRFNVLFGFKSDPYDNYTYMNQFLKIHKLKAIFFFLLGDYGKMDKNISPQNTIFMRLIQSLAKTHSIGIHPSYSSFNNETIIKKEISKLNLVTSEVVDFSRFHYLRFSFPNSYQILEKLGIKKDFSMGYADRLGFRAGTCTPFYFYDLDKEEITDLKIVPFVYMDGVLNDKLKYNPKQSIQVIKDIKKQVKNVEGQFTSIWHNESLSNQDRWFGWREVFESTWLD